MSRPIITALAWTALLAGPVALAGSSQDTRPGEPIAQVGRKAPSFALADTEGTEHRLEAYVGRIVVLEWIDPECPVCQRLARDGLMRRTVEQLERIDPKLVYLAVNSTHGRPPEVTKAFFEEYELSHPALIDAEGTVARRYGARTTPHLFVIDAKGILRYEGALNDDPTGKKARRGEEILDYAVNTVMRIRAGKRVEPKTVRPWGCQIRSKPNL